MTTQDYTTEELASLNRLKEMYRMAMISDAVSIEMVTEETAEELGDYLREVTDAFGSDLNEARDRCTAGGFETALELIVPAIRSLAYRFAHGRQEAGLTFHDMPHTAFVLNKFAVLCERGNALSHETMSAESGLLTFLSAIAAEANDIVERWPVLNPTQVSEFLELVAADSKGARP